MSAEAEKAHALELERLAEATEQGVPFKRKHGHPPGKKVKLRPNEYNRTRRRPRKRCTPRLDKFSPHAAKHRERCSSPEWRAMMEEKVWGPRRRGEVRSPRMGIPDGYTREKADAMMAVAAEKAEVVLSKLKDKGVLSNLPVKDADRAETAMRELLTIGLSDLAAQVRVAALSQVLKFCKPAPERKSKVTVESAEAWLEAAIADDDDDEADGQSEASEAP